MLTARYRKMPGDRRRYALDLEYWLGASESIYRTEVVAQNGITVDALAVVPPHRKQVVFYVEGGDAGEVYRVKLTSHTTEDQVRVDIFEFVIDGGVE